MFCGGFEYFRQHIDYIGCHNRAFTELCGGVISGKSVNIYSKLCGIFKRKPLCQKRTDNSGKHIAASSGRHTAVAAHVDIQLIASGRGNDRVVILQYTYATVFFRNLGGNLSEIVTDLDRKSVV